jgi:hypothetical protein
MRSSHREIPWSMNLIKVMFICGGRGDFTTLLKLDCIASIGRMIDKRWLWMDFEVICCGLIRLLSRNLPEWMDDKQNNEICNFLGILHRVVRIWTKVLEHRITSTSRILPSHLPTPWFLSRLIFNPEDGGNTFLRNVCLYAYAELCPRINLRLS